MPKRAVIGRLAAKRRQRWRKVRLSAQNRRLRLVAPLRWGVELHLRGPPRQACLKALFVRPCLFSEDQPSFPDVSFPPEADISRLGLLSTHCRDTDGPQRVRTPATEMAITSGPASSCEYRQRTSASHRWVVLDMTISRKRPEVMWIDALTVGPWVRPCSHSQAQKRPMLRRGQARSARNNQDRADKIHWS